MSITDELREWGYGFCGDTHDVVTAIADRIDEEHERLMKEQPYTIDMVPMTDEHMAEHGWIRMPKDADGVPIRVGDVMEWPTTGETFEVVGIGDGTLFYVEDGSECADWTGASTKRHHHAPTVEDVLEELLREYDRDDSELTNGEIVEMFAKRLQLREDA